MQSYILISACFVLPGACHNYSFWYAKATKRTTPHPGPEDAGPGIRVYCCSTPLRAILNRRCGSGKGACIVAVLHVCTPQAVLHGKKTGLTLKMPTLFASSKCSGYTIWPHPASTYFTPLVIKKNLMPPPSPQSPFQAFRSKYFSTTG